MTRTPSRAGTTNTTDRLLERALAAKRESRRVAFRSALDAKDIVAMANSGGGVIVLDAEIDPEQVVAEIRRHTDSEFDDFEIREITRDSRRAIALIVHEAAAPIVFNDPPGTLYFRHGSKSAPATSADVEDAIARRVRRTITTALRRGEAPVLPREIRDSESPDATPIRVVNDPRAPAFRLVDYDKTHPYRQKEVLSALHARLPGSTINQFDLQAVRHVLKTDENREFAHKPVFGTRQYSAKFIDWLVDQAQHDPSFFTRAREEYIRGRKAQQVT